MCFEGGKESNFEGSRVTAWVRKRTSSHHGLAETWLVPVLRITHSRTGSMDM